MRLVMRLLVSLFLGAVFLCGPATVFAQESSVSAPSKTAAEEPKIPDAYLNEADQFFNYCEATPRYRKFYNCECLAASFLNERINQGPDVPRSGIMLDIEKQCADGAEASAETFNACMDRPSLLPPGTDTVKYCECFANTYGKLYEQNPGTGTKASIRLQSQAHLTCSNPALAKKMYPGTQGSKP